MIEMGWSRKDCLAYLKDRLPHPVPKSSCVFCPYRTNQSWRHLKQTDPDGWNRAVQIDNALRDQASVCTRGFREVIDFDALSPSTIDPMTVGECQGMYGL